jgi:PAS domain S-box-containing protein
MGAAVAGSTSEEELRRLNRAYQALSLCNADVSRATSEAELLSSMCRTLVEVGGYPLAWVGVGEREGHRVGRVAVHARDGAEGYLEGLALTWGDDPLGHGPTGTAIRTGRATVNRDSESNPDYEPWRERARQFGLRSSIALPLRFGEGPRGALMVYAALPEAFAVEERALLERLADHVTSGVETLRARAAQAHVEITLRDLDNARTRFAILDEAPYGFVALDRRWRYVYVNAAGARLVGEKRETLLGRSMWDVYPSQPGTQLWELLHRSMDLGETVEFEVANRLRPQWFEIRAYPTPAGIAIHFTDISPRKQLELQLRESEERFRELAENIQDVFWLRSPDGRYAYVSPAFERVWGRPAESLKGLEDWLATVHPDDRERIRRSMPTESTGSWDETYRFLHPDGSVRWVRARAYPVRDRSGTVVRIAGVARDVTENRRLEELYRQAQKMEAVGRLAGGVAHDFNNLLSVILGYTLLLRRDLPEGSSAAEGLDEIERAGTRAADLTRQLLAFSRQQVLAPRVVDLPGVLLGMEKMLQRMLGEDVELSLRAGPEGGRVFADAGQLEQVVMNLAVNARDAMPKGGRLSIEVGDARLEAREASALGVAPGRYLTLSFEDTGVGMDATTRERAFEPFFTTKEVGKGTGLGLATVFGIVRQSHGGISVSSEPGRGTTFRVYLPRTDRLPDRTEPAHAEPSRVSGSETILLVEDEAQVRTVTGRILRGAGYEVLDASEASDAVRVSQGRAAPIHLLLTDVVMPRVGGRELAEQLVPTRPGMRILYVSGYTEDNVIHRGVLEAGVSFLQKPFTPEALLRKVREVLDGA